MKGSKEEAVRGRTQKRDYRLMGKKHGSSEMPLHWKCVWTEKKEQERSGRSTSDLDNRPKCLLEETQ